MLVVVVCCVNSDSSKEGKKNVRKGKRRSVKASMSKWNDIDDLVAAKLDAKIRMLSEANKPRDEKGIAIVKDVSLLLLLLLLLSGICNTRVILICINLFFSSQKDKKVLDPLAKKNKPVFDGIVKKPSNVGQNKEEAKDKKKPVSCMI